MLKCRRSKNVYYCNENCQSLDCKEDKERCKDNDPNDTSNAIQVFEYLKHDHTMDENNESFTEYMFEANVIPLPSNSWISTYRIIKEYQ